MLDKLVKALLISSLSGGCAQGVMGEGEEENTFCYETNNECEVRADLDSVFENQISYFNVNEKEIILLAWDFSEEENTFILSSTEGGSFEAQQGGVYKLNDGSKAYVGRVDSANGEAIVYVVGDGVETRELNLLASSELESKSDEAVFHSDCQKDRKYKFEVFREGVQMPENVLGPGVALDTGYYNPAMQSPPKFFTSFGTMPFYLTNGEIGVDSFIIRTFKTSDYYASAIINVFENIGCLER